MIRCFCVTLCFILRVTWHRAKNGKSYKDVEQAGGKFLEWKLGDQKEDQEDSWQGNILNTILRLIYRNTCYLQHSVSF